MKDSNTGRILIGIFFGVVFWMVGIGGVWLDLEKDLADSECSLELVFLMFCFFQTLFIGFFWIVVLLLLNFIIVLFTFLWYFLFFLGIVFDFVKYVVIVLPLFISEIVLSLSSLYAQIVSNFFSGGVPVELGGGASYTMEISVFIFLFLLLLFSIQICISICEDLKKN